MTNSCSAVFGTGSHSAAAAWHSTSHATLAGREREQTRELLETPRELARWFVAAGLAKHAVKLRSESETARNEGVDLVEAAGVEPA